jgi:hypothetical protein
MTGYAVHTTFLLDENQHGIDHVKTRTTVSIVEVRAVPEGRRIEVIRDNTAQITADILNERRWFFVDDSESDKSIILRTQDINKVEIEVFEIREEL